MEYKKMKGLLQLLCATPCKKYWSPANELLHANICQTSLLFETVNELSYSWMDYHQESNESVMIAWKKTRIDVKRKKRKRRNDFHVRLVIDLGPYPVELLCWSFLLIILSKMLQPVSTLPLSKITASNLATEGYVFVEDFRITPVNAPVNFVNVEVINDVSRSPITLSALHHWQAELQYERFTTFSEVINDLLEGGIQCGIITEICGPSGSGKTQLCFQISITVQLSSKNGGLNGRALYIDTKNAFSTQRIQDLIKGCQSIYPYVDLDRSALAENITIFSPSTFEKLFLFIKDLKKYMQSTANRSPIRVIIIDSFAFSMSPMSTSSRKVSHYQQILDELQKLASKHNIAVIIVNELVTQVDINGEIYFESAGGQATRSRCNKGLMLTRMSDSRFAARLLKSSTMSQVAILFNITADGIRDEVNRN